VVVVFWSVRDSKPNFVLGSWKARRFECRRVRAEVFRRRHLSDGGRNYEAGQSGPPSDLCT
jgi:hypothetical protein